MTQTDRYLRYYLDQQQGNGMPVFVGGAWQRGHGLTGFGQTGFGLGGLFRSMARVVMPMVKSGAKTMGKIALNTGANVLGDVLSGQNVKQAAKFRINEATKNVKKKAVDKLRTIGQTGNGKRGRMKTSGKRTNKNRKASSSIIIRKPTKKQRTARMEDIFG